MPLAKLLANFEPPAKKVVAVAEKTPENQPANVAVVSVTSSNSNNQLLACSKCGGLHMWRTRHNETWFCFQCNRPPVLSLMFEQRGQPVGSAAGSVAVAESSGKSGGQEAIAPTTCRIHYTTPEEPCTGCRGSLFIETTRSDFSYDVTCWVCKRRKEV